MLYTLLLWSYILITCFICGFFFLSRLHGGRISFAGCVMGGIALLTAYGEYFSLFAGVSLVANIILIIACSIFVILDRKKYSALKRPSLKEALPLMVAAVPVILVCAYFTAAGSFTYDTGTYHAQSIHWIETYGLVKGLAHMQTRLAFNSAYFSLCALYSFSFLGQSMHVLSGFLGAFVMVCSLRGLLLRRREDGTLREPGVSDLAYMAPFGYFLIIAVEIISPSTDHGTIWLILWLLIRWIECIEDDTESDKTGVFSLLSVFAVFLVSVKLSVGVLAVIVIYPLIGLIREKKYMDILRYVLMGIILILPFFIRNYLISGWLVYPFPAVDLFNPDWKVPAEGARYEADEIVVWARYTKDVALIDQSISEWFPVWWKEQGQSNRLLSMSAFAGALILAIRTLIGAIYRLVSGKKKEKDKGYLFFGGALLISFLFFMVSAPSNRFGYGYILMVPLYGVGDLAMNVYKNRSLRKKKAVAAVLAISLVIPAFAAVTMARGLWRFASDDKNYALNTGVSAFLIQQKDYPAAQASSKEWEGMTIYFPVVEGEQIWYHAFPAILYEGNLEGTVRRGDNIRDGFKLK